MEAKYALLIDAENVSPKYIEPIMNELSKYGRITYKRIYGDWRDDARGGWMNGILENAITPVQQLRYVAGKNASDSAMIIDAMDILYTGNVDGFCLISSDSDFTRLTDRLREGGMQVIVMGEEKTPKALRKACDIFTVLENLIEDDDTEKTSDDERDTILSKSLMERAIRDIITENQNKGKRTNLGEVGSRLLKLYPDFDVRLYGYSLLSKFLESLPKFELETENGHHVFVKLKSEVAENEDVQTFIKKRVKASGKKGISLGDLGRIVHEKFSDFKTSDYGYSRFYKFVESIESISLKKGENDFIAICKE